LAACLSAGFLGLFKGRYLKPLTVGTSLMLFQQITGQPSVLYYAADIFNKAGIGAGKDATGVSVILGLFKLVMTGVPTAYIHSFMRQFQSVHAIRCSQQCQVLCIKITNAMMSFGRFGIGLCIADG